MAKRPHSSARDPRGDGKWLAYGISMLAIFALFPHFHRLAIAFFNQFLAEGLADYEIAGLLVYPILGCILVIFFFGFSFLLTFGSRLGLFSLMTRMGR